MGWGEEKKGGGCGRLSWKEMLDGGGEEKEEEEDEEEEEKEEEEEEEEEEKKEEEEEEGKEEEEEEEEEEKEEGEEEDAEELLSPCSLPSCLFLFPLQNFSFTFKQKNSMEQPSTPACTTT